MFVYGKGLRFIKDKTSYINIVHVYKYIGHYAYDYYMG